MVAFLPSIGTIRHIIALLKEDIVNSPFILRHAHSHESQTLTELCVRSKAVWEYSDLYMRQCAKKFNISEDSIRKKHVLVVTEVGRDNPIAVSAYEPNGLGSVELTYFFVDPKWMRRGVGSFLYMGTYAILSAVGGNRCLYFDSDRHAREFYSHMGAKCTGFRRSETRIHPRIPIFEHALSGYQPTAKAAL